MNAKNATNDLIFDIDSLPVFESVEIINEENGEKEKKYKISGVFSTIGKKNRNGRVYPRDVWERAVQKYQSVIQNGEIEALMEYEHPPRTTVDQMQAVGRITKLWIEGDVVLGEAFLLNNEKANQLKSLIDNDIKISVSSRGKGTTKDGVVTDFELVTYDIVSYPSDFNATMNGQVESVKGDMFEMNEGIVYGLPGSGSENAAMYLDAETEKAKDEYILQKINEIVGNL